MKINGRVQRGIYLMECVNHGGGKRAPEGIVERRGLIADDICQPSWCFHNGRQKRQQLCATSEIAQYDKNRQ